MTKISTDTVKHIAVLARIPVTIEEEVDFADGFTKTLEVVDRLFKLDIEDVEPTNHVTGLENVLREDEVDTEKMLSQDVALSNTKNSHGGYFVVDQVLEED